MAVALIADYHHPGERRTDSTVEAAATRGTHDLYFVSVHLQRYEPKPMANLHPATYDRALSLFGNKPEVHHFRNSSVTGGVNRCK